MSELRADCQGQAGMFLPGLSGGLARWPLLLLIRCVPLVARFLAEAKQADASAEMEAVLSFFMQKRGTELGSARQFLQAGSPTVPLVVAQIPFGQRVGRATGAVYGAAAFARRPLQLLLCGRIQICVQGLPAFERLLPGSRFFYHSGQLSSLSCRMQVLRLLVLYHDPELCMFLDTRKIFPEHFAQTWVCADTVDP
jgi:hypothetical protein